MRHPYLACEATHKLHRLVRDETGTMRDAQQTAALNSHCHLSQLMNLAEVMSEQHKF